MSDRLQGNGGTAAFGRGVWCVAARLARAAIVLVLAIRAALWLAAAGAVQFTSDDAFHLESKMVYLARLVARGEPLYPDWTAFPYEANFYAPGYFVLTGTLGRLVVLGDDGLRHLGQLTTNVCALILALVVMAVAVRDTGRWSSGCVAGLSALSAAPLVGFGHMVRPDVMAAAAGFAGFALWTWAPRRAWRWAALPLLLLAVLTKQTAVAGLVAAVAWEVGRDRPGSAAALVATWLVALATLVLALNGWWETRLLESLLGEAGGQFNWSSLGAVGRRMLIKMPDTCLVVVVWFIGATRTATWRGPAWWFGVASLLCNTAASFKVGVELNYYTDTAVAAALALGTLWQQWEPRQHPAAAGTRHAAWFWIPLLVLVASAPAMFQLRFLAGRYRSAHLEATTPPVLAQYRQLVRLVRDPRRRVLTDSPRLALHSVHPPPFLDPFLLRYLIDAGRVDPSELIRRIEHREYDVVLSTARIDEPGYDAYIFGYPPRIAKAILAHYRFQSSRGAMFVFLPKRSEPTR
jgi:hypothetical protein